MKLKLGKFEFEADMDEVIALLMFGVIPVISTIGLFIMIFMGIF